MKATREQTEKRGGFTLVEVLLVVAILGVLAAVIVPNLAGKQEKAMKKAARASIAGLSSAIDLYEVDTGRYPPSLNSLIQNDGAPNWSGPYIKGGLPLDPWGTQFAYTQADGGYKVISAGPDLAQGTADDITSW